jgi:hypothetical protein
MSIQRFVLALVFSTVITIVLAAGYLFYPLIAMESRSISGPETGGIAIAAGGIRSGTLLITECIVFTIVFGLMYRRRTS